MNYKQKLAQQYPKETLNKLIKEAQEQAKEIREIIRGAKQ
ncbi:hypothetical protein NIES2107_71830 (plasmid) [Nostoc carneum NIES-2107]|nr:hypothetical protein NIES2107_71830 [Nostoc carneum NIES-2107]